MCAVRQCELEALEPLQQWLIGSPPFRVRPPLRVRRLIIAGAGAAGVCCELEALRCTRAVQHRVRRRADARRRSPASSRARAAEAGGGATRDQ